MQIELSEMQENELLRYEKLKIKQVKWGQLEISIFMEGSWSLFYDFWYWWI